MKNQLRQWLLAGALLSATVQAYKLAIVPKNKDSGNFFAKVWQGCLDRSAQEGDDVECLYEGTEHANVEGTLEIINNLIDDDSVDGLSISVLDPEAYTPVINRGIAQGKHILTFDSDAPESNRLAYIGTNNFAMGKELAKLLKQIKPDGGTYGIVSGLGHNLEERVRGVRQELSDEDSAWVEVPKGSPKNGDENDIKSLQKMWELTEENAGLTAIVSVVGLPMLNKNTTLWKAFVDAHRDVLTVIADASDLQLEFMQTSYVDALVGQLPYNMGYQSAETLLNIRGGIEDGTPFDEVLPREIIPGTHQLEVLRIPLELPILIHDYNYIGQMAAVGYVLCAIITMASIACMAWTRWFRKNQVVIASQPIFLMMICFGTLLMGSAIIPLSIDDKDGQRAADTACMCSPWLINIGFTVSFSALFSKTWRLNQIFLANNPLQRIKVTEKDVMLPFIILLAINLIALTAWTIIAPLKFVRKNEEGTDPWNRPIGSYGQCRSTSGTAGDSIPYLVVIAVVNMTALCVANFQAYRARSIRTEFNESAYIGMANASFLQAVLVCLPIIFLTRESPQAYFVVLSIVLFIASGAVLGFIFVPKMLALREFRSKRGLQRSSSVRVSGLNLGISARGSIISIPSTSRCSVEGDPIKALVSQYERLTWEQQTIAMERLSSLGPKKPEQTLKNSGSSITTIPEHEASETETEALNGFSESSSGETVIKEVKNVILDYDEKVIKPVHEQKTLKTEIMALNRSIDCPNKEDVTKQSKITKDDSERRVSFDANIVQSATADKIASVPSETASDPELGLGSNENED